MKGFLSKFSPLFLVLSLFGLSACNTAPAKEELVVDPDLKIEDISVGTGDEALTGDTVAVKYTGMLEDGTVFDATSLHGDEPFAFTVGAGQVIQGWEQGIPGMKVGGKRRLFIPADLAYGSQARGPIPADSNLIFEVELIAIKPE